MHTWLDADLCGPGPSQQGAKRYEASCETLQHLLETFLIHIPLFSLARNWRIVPGQGGTPSGEMIPTLYTGIWVVE